jgi:ribonuclease P protein subunit RPR2
MAKSKGSKGKSVPNKHIHARLSYLHQASSYLYLARQGEDMEGSERPVAPVEECPVKQGVDHSQSRHLLSQLRAVSLKSQIRLTPQIKHTICKRCNSLLIAGRTSTETIVNESRGGKKPQGDLLVVQCDFCGNERRIAVGQLRVVKAAATVKDNRPKDVKAKVSQDGA